MRYSTRNLLLSGICLFALSVGANAVAEELKPQLNPVDDVAAPSAVAAEAPAATPSVPSMAAPAGRKLPIARDGEIIDSVGGGATEAVLPVVERNDGISYITGGIGDEEMGEMAAQEPNFNVRILISSTSGEYMGENAIRFLDKSGAEVLRVEEVGPFFYANLPAGKYTVEVASPKGTIKTAKVTAREKAPASGKIVIRFNE